jgi:uncharacterized membrane protein YadS
LVPWFVLAFLCAGFIRSTGLLPEGMLVGIKLAEVTLLGIGLVGVGAGVDLRAAHQAGARPLALGVIAWLVVVVAGFAASALTMGL